MKKNILFGIIIFLSVVFIIILNYDNILKFQYKKAINNKDCEKIYNIVDIESGNYLTKEKYIE